MKVRIKRSVADRIISIRVPASVYDQLLAKASKAGIKPAALARGIITTALARGIEVETNK